MVEVKNDIDKRNYGIDLLRILSMLFVVILHSLGRGGLLYNTNVNSLNYKAVWLMEIMSYSAVNIFALISGYVAYSDKEKKTNYANYGLLWLEIVFYGIIVTFIFDIFKITDISLRDYLIVLLPVSNNLYWYFTAYTGVFMLMPFINSALRGMDKEKLTKHFTLLLIIFSVFESIVKKFCFDGGYSFAWLLLLFIMGGIIKKCDIGKNIKIWKIIGGIVLLTLITFLFKIYGFEFSIFNNIYINNDWLVSYVSPTILTIAILYVILFSRMKINKKVVKIIKFAAPSSFAIYVLNNHRLMWDFVIMDMFKGYIDANVLIVIIYPLVFSILFTIGAILIDKIRQYIFKKLKTKEKLEFLFNKIIK